MRDTDTAELYVHATPEQVARAMLPRSVDDGTTFTTQGSWHTAAWTPTLEAWRREGRWERGRASGRTTVDLVPAGAGRTLVLVTLTPAPGRRSRGRPVRSAAADLARRIRTRAEGRAEAIGRSPLPPAAAPAAPASAPPAAAAVGYSGT